MGLFDWFGGKKEEKKTIPSEINDILDGLRQAIPEIGDMLSDDQLMEMIKQAMQTETSQLDELGETDMERMSAEECCKFGEQLLDVGRWQEAESWFIKVLEKDEKTKNYHFQYIGATTCLGSICYRRGDFTQAMELLQHALKLAEQYDSRLQQSIIYTEIGLAYASQSQYVKAIEYHKISIAIIEEIDDNPCVPYCNLGTAYREHGDLQRAIEAYEKALTLNLKIGRDSGAAIQYGNIGAILAQQGLHERAQENFRNALVIHQKLDDQESMSRQYHNLGCSYGEQGNLDQAIQMINKAINISNSIGNEPAVAQNYSSLATFYLIKGDTPQSLKFFLKSLEIQERIGDLHNAARTYYKLGMLYHKNNSDSKQTRIYYEKAKALFDMVGDVDKAQAAERLLHKL